MFIYERKTHEPNEMYKVALDFRSSFISILCIVSMITESWHGINKFFNATAILCSIDQPSLYTYMNIGGFEGGKGGIAPLELAFAPPKFFSYL